MKYRITQAVSLSIIILSSFSACVVKRPYELSKAEQELIAIREDQFVVQNSPVLVEQAGKTYDQAEILWRETNSQRVVIPLSRLALDQMAEARLSAGKLALDELAASAKLKDGLIVKKSTYSFKPMSEARKLPIENQTGDKIEGEASLNISGVVDEAVAEATAEAVLAESEPEVLPQEVPQQKEMKTVVSSNTFFNGRESILIPSNVGELDLIASYLKANPASTVVIEVHTDRSGNFETDLTLSQTQAAELRDYFLAQGLDPNRVDTFGHGSTRPLTQGQAEIEKLKNRRVEFLISFPG